MSNDMQLLYLDMIIHVYTHPDGLATLGPIRIWGNRYKCY